ncbi:MAG TPA: type II toxin-antitoxin system RelE/ParE family toxin [Verrucomicrobiae bacterium]|nr:type II toxin-antitoxin system RelE/ParE family toxin [Verrucomicrobiae bacterium]
MRIRWTPAAAADLKAIHDYLREHEPQWARLTVIELRQGIQKLKQFPQIGRPGRAEGTRELLHERLPYIVVYRVRGEAVEVLRIWHPSQDRRLESPSE